LLHPEEEQLQFAEEQLQLELGEVQEEQLSQFGEQSGAQDVVEQLKSGKSQQQQGQNDTFKVSELFSKLYL